MNSVLEILSYCTTQLFIAKWTGPYRITAVFLSLNVEIVDMRRTDGPKVRVNIERLKLYNFGLESEASDDDD